MAAGQTNPFVTDAMRDDVYERGQAIYETLKPQILPQHEGKYVVIHIEGGDYEIAPSSLLPIALYGSVVEKMVSFLAD